MKLARLSLIVALLVVLAGCAEKYADKTESMVDLPESFDSVPVASETGQAWCTDFGDPTLAGYVDEAFASNFTMLAGWARLRQAEAAADSANASLFPTVDLDASASRRTTPLPPNLPDLPGFDPNQAVNQFDASVGAAYEIDLWGRLAATREAADLEYQASRADTESLAITIASNVAESYFAVVAQNERITLIEEQLEVSEKFLQLTQLRFQQGSSTALDVQQQRQQVENLRGQITLAKQQRDTSLEQLAALLGKTRAELEAPGTEKLPAAPDIAVGIPAEMLERRPDLRAARLRVEALDERSVATARNRLPTLRLSASLFLQAEELANLFDDVFYSLLGSLTAPLFDGGRRRAETRAAEARAEAALYDYAGTLLTALSEVGTALVLQERQGEFIESLERQAESADSVLDLARDRYRVGAISYLQVLTALQSYQTIQQNLVNARRQELSYGVQLCRAVGGDWTRELEPTRHKGVQ